MILLLKQTEKSINFFVNASECILILLRKHLFSIVCFIRLQSIATAICKTLLMKKKNKQQQQKYVFQLKVIKKSILLAGNNANLSIFVSVCLRLFVCLSVYF